MYPWRRFRSMQPSCVSGSETGANFTSHHLRCERSNLEPSRKLSGRTPDVVAARSWPGTTTLPAREEASLSNVFARQTGLHTRRKSSRSSSNESAHPSSSTHSNSLPWIRAPPRCRLAASMGFTTLLFYVTLTLFFISTTSAIPLSTSHAPIHLQDRQSIPDRFGNTGNDPAPVKSQPPPFPATPTPTPSATLSTFTSSTQPTTTLTTSPNGNSNNNNSGGGGGGLGSNPGLGPPAEELQLTSPQLDISVRALAGIISGGVAFLIIVIGLGVFFYRRTRTPEINEIPIRRSKLGSRLGRRMFGSLASSSANSRANSRSSSSRASLTGDAREKQAEAPRWLVKGMIGRPKAAWVENGLLSVPKPAFMREEKEKTEDGEKWLDKGAISGPRPGRPASAEPLGRLSGMGMGMGYLK